MSAWAWDASALHHAAVADRLDVLFDIVKKMGGAPSRHVTTPEVVAELTRNGSWSRCERHLEVHDPDPFPFAELQAVGRWLAIVSSDRHSRGEATLFAWAEVHGGVVIIDDADARRAARRHGLTVHGTLWVLCQGLQDGVIDLASVEALIMTLRTAGARLPSFGYSGFEDWARRQRLL